MGLREFREAKRIGVYASTPSEISTHRIIEAITGEGSAGVQTFLRGSDF